MDDIDHILCPIKGCRRKLVPVNISSEDKILGRVFTYCPNCLLVWFTETVHDESPAIYMVKFNKRILISRNETYETYQTMALCLDQYIEFLMAAWNSKKLDENARHTLYTHLKHLEKVRNLVVYRMKKLDKDRQ